MEAYRINIAKEKYMSNALISGLPRGGGGGGDPGDIRGHGAGFAYFGRQF